jgi:phenylalanyl-tRNA synthetase alpha chain
MSYEHKQIADVAALLQVRFDELDDKSAILRAPELKSLFDDLKAMPNDQRASFGKELNRLKADLQTKIHANHDEAKEVVRLDVTAPMDVNAPLPNLFLAGQGSQHPLTSELSQVLDIFYRMGFEAVESREIDDDYHMFEVLNFPEGHPARDDYDTFVTEQTDKKGKPLIAPAHTSTMQNRVLKDRKDKLEQGESIAVVIPGRVFRNEDLDARHEHTFYQLEGVYVGKGVHAGMLIATLKTFLQTYYGKELEVKTQPFYFPFTEPSFEFAISCPFCDKKGCNVCSRSGWIELLGCGMIHPNVLRHAGIDPETYTGFAWGCGIERLVMMKYGIEDVRHFESGKLDFLRQFS